MSIPIQPEEKAMIHFDTFKQGIDQDESFWELSQTGIHS